MCLKATPPSPPPPQPPPPPPPPQPHRHTHILLPLLLRNQVCRGVHYSDCFETHARALDHLWAAELRAALNPDTYIRYCCVSAWHKGIQQLPGGYACVCVRMGARLHVKGTCAHAGSSPILNPAKCRAAASSLGKTWAAFGANTRTQTNAGAQACRVHAHMHSLSRVQVIWLHPPMAA